MSEVILKSVPPMESPVSRPSSICPSMLKGARPCDARPCERVGCRRGLLRDDNPGISIGFVRIDFTDERMSPVLIAHPQRIDYDDLKHSMARLRYPKKSIPPNG